MSEKGIKIVPIKKELEELLWHSNRIAWLRGLIFGFIIGFLATIGLLG